MKNLTIILTFLITLTGYAQSNYSKWKTEKFENEKIYVDLKNALENPLSVKILDLGGQNLTEIPKRIKEFKNLQVLLLGWRPKKDLDSSTIKMSQNIGGGYLHLDRNRGTVLDYNKIQQLPSELCTLTQLEYLELNYNDIKSFPDEMVNLENLKQISLFGNSTIFRNNEIIEEMELKMPNCEFLTARNFIKERKNKE